MTDAELLSAAIKASGLSVRRFAAEVLIRDPRTVWRWLRGPSIDGKGKPSTNALPVAVKARCEAIVNAAGISGTDAGSSPCS